MTMTIGAAPGTQYSGDDLVKGKCPRVGTVREPTTRTARRNTCFCLVAASQNLVDGHLVTIDPPRSR
jgi:hypothetical protein